jgi:excinuclease UvrABC ATPase subunit
MLESLAKSAQIRLDVPVSQLTKAQLDLILYGTRGEEIPIGFTRHNGHESVFYTPFEGVINNLQRRYRETHPITSACASPSLWAKSPARNATASACAKKPWPSL